MTWRSGMTDGGKSLRRFHVFARIHALSHQRRPIYCAASRIP